MIGPKGSHMKEYDLIAIGTGSAMNIVDLVLRENPNLKVAVIDKDEPGGICLTRGCIPSKILLYPAELVRTIEKASEFGVDVEIKKVSFERVMERMKTIIYKDINMIRYGQPLIDFGGFFTPLKVLLAQGRIKSTPESIYVMLNRAPMHLARTKMALVNSIEGMYWAMVDSAHAALVAAKRVPPSPEQVPTLLKEVFVDNRLLDKKYIVWYEELYKVAHGILHGSIKEIKASEIDQFEQKTDLFLREMAKLVGRTIK